MSVVLANATCTATILERGAELASHRSGPALTAAEDRREYIWNGDPAWWTGRAPILFPVVGTLKDGASTHEGRRYSLPGLGFARVSDFEVARQSGA